MFSVDNSSPQTKRLHQRNLYSVYIKLKNVNKGFLDCRLGTTQSCLVAENKKLNLQSSYILATTTKLSNQVKIEKGEVNTVLGGGG